jgi:hypothetical protein
VCDPFACRGGNASVPDAKRFGVRSAATKHIGPNGVRPWGEHRSPLRDASKSSRDNNVPETSATERNEQTGNVIENKGPLWKACEPRRW